MAREVSFEGERQLGNAWTQIREFMSRSAEAGALVGFIAVLAFFIITTSDLKSKTPEPLSITNLPSMIVKGDVAFSSPQILTARSVSSFVTNASSYGILAVGVAILMIAGEFDLSVGSMLGLSALVFIICLESGLGGLADIIFPGDWVEKLGLSYQSMAGPIAIIIALLTGALMGLFNGLLRIGTRIHSFIVTLGTLYIFRAIMYNTIPGGTIARFTHDPIMYTFHPLVVVCLGMIGVLIIVFFLWPSLYRNFQRLREGNNGIAGPIFNLVVMGIILLVEVSLIIGIISMLEGNYSDNVSVDFFNILNGRLTFWPLSEGNYLASIVWWFHIAALFHIILTQTRFGNAVFATGGNPGAALAQGIRVNRTKIAAFVLSGVMAAVGGIMEVARFEVVEPLRGTGYELDVIAAVVIGGTLLTGGYGSIIGALIGVLISGILKTGLVLIGVDATWFRGVLGVIMITAVIINTNIRRER